MTKSSTTTVEHHHHLIGLSNPKRLCQLPIENIFRASKLHFQIVIARTQSANLIETALNCFITNVGRISSFNVAVFFC